MHTRVSGPSKVARCCWRNCQRARVDRAGLPPNLALVLGLTAVAGLGLPWAALRRAPRRYRHLAAAIAQAARPCARPASEPLPEDTLDAATSNAGPPSTPKTRRATNKLPSGLNLRPWLGTAIWVHKARRKDRSTASLRSTSRPRARRRAQPAKGRQDGGGGCRTRRSAGGIQPLPLPDRAPAARPIGARSSCSVSSRMSPEAFASAAL